MQLWRIWQLFDARQVIIGLGAFLFGLAVMIHFVLLSTEKYNWFDGPRVTKSSAAVPGLPK
ncbi:MAG: light-harvesting protein [Hyphomicrobiaceae bacterium]|nr:light-harvesting protein [Hyphomicrobiaceae bacterium]